MKRHSRRQKFAAIGSITVAIAGYLTLSQVAGRAEPNSNGAGTEASVPAGYSGLNDPNLVSCMQAHKVCNPAAAEANQGPESQPPGTGQPLSRTNAEALARGSGLAPSKAVYSRLFASGDAFERAFNEGRATTYDVSRPVWVITVMRDVMTDGSPGTPGSAKAGYSVVIDALTGRVTDECIGCLWLGSSG